MGAPTARAVGERPRDWMNEAYILSTVARIADPMRLQIGEWNGLLDAAARGDLRRSEPMDPRSFVDCYMAKG